MESVSSGRSSERTRQNDDDFFAAFKRLGAPAKSQISWGSDIPEIPLDLGISLEREELGEDSAE